jgi:S1-C subfamily serine protease
MDAHIGLARALVPTTVTLRVEIPASHSSVPVLGEERMGSGVLVERGLLLTVNYVVIGARRITATLPDGRECPAEVVAQDYESGIAVLRIPILDTAVAIPGDSRRLALGQPVFILACTGPTERRVSDGLVTDLSPFDAYWEYRLETAIQTSAVNPGLGGGPLFDVRGRLAGLISLNLGQMAHFSLAIPVHYFSEAREELLRDGRRNGPRRAWVGIYTEATPSGMMIGGLVADGPAVRAGLREGDVILTVNFREIVTRAEMYEVLWAVPAGGVVRFGILRDAERVTLEVVSVDRAEFYR